MVPIARRNLLGDKLRLAISIGGVGLSVMLVVLLDGFVTGMTRQITAYIDNTPADYYVSQKGVASFPGASPVVPVATIEQLATVPGVASAFPLLAQYAIIDLHEKKLPVLLLAYDGQRGGGPWQILAGRTLTAPDEIVVDAVLAERHGLKLGETIPIMGRQFRIVGLSGNTTSWMVSLIFLDHQAATTLYRAQGTTGYVLVRGDGTLKAESIQRGLPEYSVVDRATIARNSVAQLAGMFSAPMRAMVLIALAIGALLVGLTIYSATVERFREYGVLKAVGMRNRALYGIVARQALAAAGLGFVAGIALIWVVAAAITRLWPQFLIVVDEAAILRALLGAVGMAVLAAVLPARYAATIDPARIFRR